MEIFGITAYQLIKLTGYLAFLSFILNFATCFAMPWSRDKCPWKGARPGCDPEDSQGRFTLSHYHHYFTWLTIFFVIIHFLLAKIF